MGSSPLGTGLGGAQRWLQRAMLAPESPCDAAAMLDGSASLSAEQRLNIYRGGYRQRLREVLRQLHPASYALLGPELFDDFADAYLADCPSRSYTLARLSQRWADQLSAHRPDRDRPAGQREVWIDLLVDLVRYERTFTDVYDGPGAAPGTDPGLDSGAGTGTGTLAPLVRPMRACAAVHRYHAAIRGGRDALMPVPRPTHLVVWRRDFRVVTTELAPSAFALLTALTRGAALRAAAAETGVGLARAVTHLRRWQARGWVYAHAIDPPDPIRLAGESGRTDTAMSASLELEDA